MGLSRPPRRGFGQGSARWWVGPVTRSHRLWLRDSLALTLSKNVGRGESMPKQFARPWRRRCEWETSSRASAASLEARLGSHSAPALPVRDDQRSRSPARPSFFCPSPAPALFCHASFLGHFQLSTARPDSDTGPAVFSNPSSIPSTPAKVATTTVRSVSSRRSSCSLPSTYPP